MPAAATHALDHLRYNLDRREMQSKEGSRRISASECIAPRNRPHTPGSPRSLCRPTRAAVRAVVARACSRSPRRLPEGSRKPPRRVAARAGRRLSPPGCDCARRRVPPAPGVARVDCHAVARLKKKAVRDWKDRCGENVPTAPSPLALAAAGGTVVSSSPHTPKKAACSQGQCEETLFTARRTRRARPPAGAAAAR